MPDPATATYLDIPGVFYLWLLTLASFFLFGRRAWQYVHVLRGARAEPRWDQARRRLKLVVTHVLGQRRLMEEPVIGAAHLVIFWAFVVYAGSFFWNLARGLFPLLPVPYADEVPWLAFCLAAFAVLGLVALAVAAVRRYILTPPRLETSLDAGIILALIAVVLLSSLAGQVLRVRAPAAATAMWWLHMATVLGFLAYLPYSKHLHLLASPFGVLFSSLQPGGMPVASEGAGWREEFSWRQLFSGLACAECGRCDRACPAFNSGAPLSPKMLMHHVKELVRRPANGHTGKPFTGGTVKPEEIWACSTCYACMTRCPVFNEHIPLLVEMRRFLVAQGETDRGLQDAMTSLSRYGNSFGASPRNRTRWTENLGFKVKDARKEPVAYLWFVGDYASYDPRLAEATRAAARVFQAARLDFGILYEAEQNSGNDIRRAGEEGLYEVLVEKNLKALGKAHFERIVTTDPHTYHALKNEYPGKNGNRNVVHSTELVASLIRRGDLSLKKSLGLKATYHDPCYLGRYNQIYDAPRRVVVELGAAMVEMPRNRSNAYCCGAGGGRIWMEDTPGVHERPAESRVREAAGVKGVDTLVVSCPKDLVMFQDALKTTGLEGRIAVKDLMQMVEEAL